MSPETFATLEQIALWLIRVAAVAGTAAWLLYSTAPFYKSLLGRALWTSMLGWVLVVDLALMFRVWDGHLAAKTWIALGVYAVVSLGSVLLLLAVAQLKWGAFHQTRAWRTWRANRAGR